MKIIFVNRFFYPDHSATSQMLSDLAFALAGCGHTVQVITSRLIYEGDGLLNREVEACRAREGLRQRDVPPLSAARTPLQQPFDARRISISLKPILEGLIVPSKYYGIAAAGRPAIFVGNPTAK